MTIHGMGWADVLEYRTPDGKDFFVADGVIETLETRPGYVGAAFIVKPASGWEFRMDPETGHYCGVKAFVGPVKYWIDVEVRDEKEVGFLENAVLGLREHFGMVGMSHPLHEGWMFYGSQDYTTEVRRRTGVQLIHAERQRQIMKEGWTAEHDDDQGKGQLWRAAECYINPGDVDVGSRVSWDKSWFKPGSRIRNLVKAGALIAAEIDRLQRLEYQGR